MVNDAYLVVTVRMSMYDMVILPAPTQEAVLDWLQRHGIDVAKEFSWEDEPTSCYRVYTQTHRRSHVTQATATADTES